MTKNVHHKMQTFSYLVFSSENSHLFIVKHQGAHHRAVRNRFHVSVFYPHNVHDKVKDFYKSLKVPEQILQSPECLAGTVLFSSSYITCSGFYIALFSEFFTKKELLFTKLRQT